MQGIIYGNVICFNKGILSFQMYITYWLGTPADCTVAFNLKLLYNTDVKNIQSSYVKELVANFKPLLLILPSSIIQIDNAKGVKKRPIFLGTHFMFFLYQSSCISLKLEYVQVWNLAYRLTLPNLPKRVNV